MISRASDGMKVTVSSVVATTGTVLLVMPVPSSVSSGCSSCIIIALYQSNHKNVPQDTHINNIYALSTISNLVTGP